MDDRLVCYSLMLPPKHPRPDLVWQLTTSISSLRRYNVTVPIVVFVYGESPPNLAPTLSEFGVMLRSQGSYEDALARLLPRAAPALSRYPILHRFLNFTDIASLHPQQVLSLDCDTLFSGDVALLFSRYATADCYGREEPTCQRSHLGYDAGYLNETQLAQLAASLGIRIPPPFNLGVVLWNNTVWQRLPDLSARFLAYAWRLCVSLAMHPAQGRSLEFVDNAASRFAAAHAETLITPDDRDAALPYPSANRWILDEVALWLALGRVPDLTYTDFSRDDVVQALEFRQSDPRRPNWIVCHYYSRNMYAIARWLELETSGVAAPPRRDRGSASIG